jgi:Penicillin binding protein transpeptidase domain
MGGKTGTSQVRRISKSERAKGVIPNEKRPWEDRDHALFISFAPVQNPRYVCAVVVEHGGGGSKNAAPIARDLLMRVMKLDPAKALDRPLVTSGDDDDYEKAVGEKTSGEKTSDKAKDKVPDATPDTQLEEDEDLMLEDDGFLDDPH